MFKGSLCLVQTPETDTKNLALLPYFLVCRTFYTHTLECSVLTGMPSPVLPEEPDMHMFETQYSYIVTAEGDDWIILFPHFHLCSYKLKTPSIN